MKLPEPTLRLRLFLKSQPLLALASCLLLVRAAPGFAAAPPASAVEAPAELLLEGSGWSLVPFSTGRQAFSNRTYVWQNIPAAFENWRATQTAGGSHASLKVTAKSATTLHAITAESQKPLGMEGWTPLPEASFFYNDDGRTKMSVFRREIARAETLVIPQTNWGGLQLLLPPSVAVQAKISELPPSRTQLVQMSYNHPGLVVDLAVGLWAWPLPMDFNGDGRTDLVVSCPDKPSNGTYVFAHPGTVSAPGETPVFLPGKRISEGRTNAQVSYIQARPTVLTPGLEYPDFLKTGLAQPRKLAPPANIHPNKVRANQWRYVDYDGDGVQDLVVGVGDWTDYGWDNGYDAKGRWLRGPLRGFVYLLRNEGSDNEPRYAAPLKLEAGGRPIETFGMPSPSFADFKNNGKLDLICGEFLDGFTYFENIGSRTRPQYAPGRRLQTAAHQPLVMDLQMITPVAFDWDGDGRMDLICGDEDGRVALLKNTGAIESQAPVFMAPRYFQQQADTLKCGALATPVGFDWDGDGDVDLIAGNSAGYVLFFENLSGPGVEYPKWAAPKPLEVDGEPLRIMAGPNGSIQGPAEAKWGYTTLSVADWDSDGLPDLIVNSIWGRVVWYKNVGSINSPKLAAAKAVEVEWEGAAPELAWGWQKPEGKALLTQWRTTPVVVDWNGDGLQDLIMLDHEGYLVFFERALSHGKRVLLPPKRALCDESGNPLRLNARTAGGSGRRKLCAADWDGDGKLDLLLNSKNATLLRQVDTRDGKWFFKDLGPLSEDNVEGHDTSPTTVDFNNDGAPDLVIGAEDGRFYYFRNPRSQ